MYIRTKDGVYEVKVNKYHELVYCKNNQIVLSCNIIKQSENIEELCDRFVVMDKETKEVISIVSFLEYAKLWSYCKYNIYGAIWTDKGLIYVAKMNDEGDLVLIWAIFGLDG